MQVGAGELMRSSVVRWRLLLRVFLFSVSVLSFAGVLIRQAAAEGSEYPTKALTMIVPFPAGGRTDVVGRIVAQGLAKKLNKSVAVINKPGASSVLGAREVADAAPDGYTIGFFSTSAVTSQYTVPTPISLSHFQIVAIVNTDPAAIAVQWSARWKSLKELVEDARKQPGKLRMGMIPGASAQIFAAGFEHAAGVNMIQVPFKGDSDGAIALAGGHIDVHVAVPVAYQSLMQAKKVRMLAVAAKARSPLYNDLPTFLENGVDLVIGAFHGVFVPAGTPRNVIDKLAEALGESMRSAEVTANMERVGAAAAYLRADDAAAFLQKQDVTYRDIIERLGLSANAGK
jgi:tripartite-type tricarboxylate transporter receptor subunit TctC